MPKISFLVAFLAALSDDPVGVTKDWRAALSDDPVGVTKDWRAAGRNSLRGKGYLVAAADSTPHMTFLHTRSDHNSQDNIPVQTMNQAQHARKKKKSQLLVR
uniref:Uncharacterized protein n=1 Tax=Oryza brachyantha TaxID=4533 RepID=J3LNV5_ORYBR